jgi:hypothetical protein
MDAAVIPTRDCGIAPDTTAGGGEITPSGTAYSYLDILGPATPGYLSQATIMPGALVEPLFITNPTDADHASSDRGQHILAAAITTNNPATP